MKSSLVFTIALSFCDSAVADLPHKPFESRIVGGTTAGVDEFPFYVSWSGCGASLVAPDMLLTAAHCNPTGTNRVKINHSRNSNGISKRIVQRFPHPSYNDRTLNYDYMVMKLDSPVSGIDPISINPQNSVPQNNEELTVIGWGRLSSGGASARDLQKVNVNAISHNVCNNRYGGDVEENTMFCAGVNGGGKDSCQGDSGGPIFVENQGSFVQVGIVSWGQGCAEARYPGVYSRISGEFEWIKRQICNNSDYKPSFCGGDDSDGWTPTPIPPNSGNELVTVRLEIQFDQYPQDLQWELRQGTMTESSDGQNLDANSLHTWEATLYPGEASFTITDSYKDGIGNGYYTIFAVNPGGGPIELAFGGEFDITETKTFVVPSFSGENNQSPPIQGGDGDDSGGGSGCQDSSSGTFWVNDNLENKNCDWLSINMQRFEYLCQFLDVSVACKQTCNVCNYFE